MFQEGSDAAAATFTDAQIEQLPAVFDCVVDSKQYIDSEAGQQWLKSADGVRLLAEYAQHEAAVRAKMSSQFEWAAYAIGGAQPSGSKATTTIRAGSRAGTASRAGRGKAASAATWVGSVCGPVAAAADEDAADDADSAVRADKRVPVAAGTAAPAAAGPSTAAPPPPVTAAATALEAPEAGTTPAQAAAVNTLACMRTIACMRTLASYDMHLIRCTVHRCTVFVYMP